MPNHCKRCGAYVSAAEPGSISADLDQALEAARWVGDADAATVGILRSLATRLDQIRSATTLFGETESNVSYDAQIMLRYLGALLLTPEAREVDTTPAEGGGDLIATLRDIGTAGR